MESWRAALSISSSDNSKRKHNTFLIAILIKLWVKSIVSNDRQFLILIFNKYKIRKPSSTSVIVQWNTSMEPLKFQSQIIMKKASSVIQKSNIPCSSPSKFPELLEVVVSLELSGCSDFWAACWLTGVDVEEGGAGGVVPSAGGRPGPVSCFFSKNCRRCWRIVSADGVLGWTSLETELDVSFWDVPRDPLKFPKCSAFTKSESTCTNIQYTCKLKPTSEKKSENNKKDDMQESKAERRYEGNWLRLLPTSGSYHFMLLKLIPFYRCIAL